MPEKESFILNRLRSIGFAFKGAVLLLKTEASIQIQCALAIIMTIAGFYFDISATEWMIQIVAIGMVISIEGLNTALEEMANFIHPDQHTKIGFIKDIAAGAVFISSISAIIVGFIIYFPKIF